MRVARNLLIVAALVPLASVPASAAQLVVNGKFSNGLSGWTEFLTPNGNANNEATTYDLLGTGPQTALRTFVVGKTGGNIAAGGGVQQTVTVGAKSIVTFRADVAATTSIGPGGGNADGGTFALTINGTPVATYSVGIIFHGQVFRSTLFYTGPTDAGSLTLGLLSTRDYGFTSDLSQYYSNVTFSAVPVNPGVPEPASWAMLIAGFGLTGAAARRRRVVRVAA